MKLLLDIGNSRLKWAQVGREGALVQPAGGVDHYVTGLAQALESLELEQPPESVWISSVAGADAEEAVSDWVSRCWSLTPVFIRSQAQCCGLSNAYADPEKLGVDRWLAMIAAYHRGTGPVCVVDAGTAITVDAISADGQHMGGLIAPGIAGMRQILTERTQLPPLHENAGLAGLMRDTESAIASGTLQSVLALVERAYARLVDELGEKPRALLTGGEAALLYLHLLADWTHAPHLVLEGLARYAQANESGAG